MDRSKREPKSYKAYLLKQRREITKDINKIMGLVSKSLPDQPNLKSHSFRISFITQLWKATNDIEFVR